MTEWWCKHSSASASGSGVWLHWNRQFTDGGEAILDVGLMKNDRINIIVGPLWEANVRAKVDFCMWCPVLLHHCWEQYLQGAKTEPYFVYYVLNV